MKKTALFKSLFLASASSLLVSGCVVRERVVYRPPPPPPAPVVVVPEPVVAGEIFVTAAPPPPIVEQVTVSPGPAFVWIGGNWVWHGKWMWERGHWARPPHPGAVWVPHRYVYRNGRHVFINGGWR
jgi:hypothetical protein